MDVLLSLVRWRSFQCGVVLVLVGALTFTGGIGTYAAGASPLSVDTHTSSGYSLSDPAQLTANYTYLVDAAGSSFQLSLRVIQPFAYVSTANTVVTVEPNLPYVNRTGVDNMGNTVLTVSFSSPQHVLGKFRLTVLQHFTVYSISYVVDPSKVGEYDVNSPLYKLYTQPAPYVESANPEIVAKAKEIVGGETNPYLAAQRIQNFVIAHITYDESLLRWNPPTEGALFAFRSGRGVCRHFAALFTALARAAGIPTAEIHGSRGDMGSPVVDPGNYKHLWTQFFVPNYGWIPADPTVGTFAKLDNNHVPVMVLNYDVCAGSCNEEWWSGGQVQQTAAWGLEPEILQGFQGPEPVAEFNTIASTVLAISLLAATALATRTQRKTRELKTQSERQPVGKSEFCT